MDRLLMNDLLKWKNKKDRKPLLMKGIRQCGKTYLLKEFGKNQYNDVAYFNFEGNLPLQARFARDLDVGRIISELGILLGKPIIPGETLVIFDEIQFCNSALTSLKYFYENTPQYHIVSAGSLLGVALSKPLSFPVGKVDMLTLRPMNYFEFLLANNEKQLCDYLQKLSNKEAVSPLFADKLENYLRTFFMTGGMPEVVHQWLQTKDVSVVDEILKRILDNYELDFAKHAPSSDFPKLSQIWHSIPDQLAKESGKFIFSHVRKGLRAKDLEDALQWLISAGLVYKINKIEKPTFPLSAYADDTYFKLYMADIGLLRKMSNLPVEILLQKTDTFGEYKGALTENFALCELLHLIEDAYYWKSENKAEVDFVAQFGGNIIPIEVKSENNNRAKSLSEYRKRYEPIITIVTSMNNVSGEKAKNIPLYLLWKIKEYINSISPTYFV